jgi:hypothetical protein
MLLKVRSSTVHENPAAVYVATEPVVQAAAHALVVLSAAATTAAAAVNILFLN